MVHDELDGIVRTGAEGARWAEFDSAGESLTAAAEGPLGIDDGET